MPGILYLVATPIGNLGDMTFRAVETLKSADLIACEDTRHSRKLLSAFDISNKLVSYHEHNENERSEELAKLLAEGKSVAVVTDAGTPGINDPGLMIVRKALEVGARVVPIPGAVAFVNAVIASGLPTDSIFFGGFLPQKSGDRRRRLQDVSNIPATLVFYESPRRIAKTLEDCISILGDRHAAVARELTKIYEEVRPARLSELRDTFTGEVRGEFVLMIDREAPPGGSEPTATLSSRVEALLKEGVDKKAALKIAAKEFGVSKSEAYRILVSEK